ncbi:MAG: flagellar hook-associated protein FlgK [Limnochordia bacterium]|jgi:flagellar hook-associated protein 1 FlgK
MRTTFSGLEIARRALQAHQRAIDVTGHNIANMNTPGYSRQVASLAASNPYPVPARNQGVGPWQVGTGVNVTEIIRVRDRFADQQIRQESQELGRWETRKNLLHQVESIYNEPSEYGIRQALDLFWQSLQDLSIHPDDLSVRAVVLQRGSVLSDALRDTRRQLVELRSDVNQTAAITVAEINDLAKQIADVNAQIGKVVSVGGQPNDLYDQRDLLLADLSKLVNISVTQRSQGMISVTIGGGLLVEADKAFALEAVRQMENAQFYDIVWAGRGTKANIESGTLAGLLEFRDQDLREQIAHLDELASTLIEKFNEIHQEGFNLGGVKAGPFFKGSSAFDIDVAITEPEKIAAGVTANRGDGENALALAQLQHQPLLSGRTATLNDYFGAMMGALGVASQQAQTRTNNQQLILEHFHNRQEMTAGVSLDEELTNLIRFQHAYNAAARLATTMDEAIEVIINRMGLVGR